MLQWTGTFEVSAFTPCQSDTWLIELSEFWMTPGDSITFHVSAKYHHCPTSFTYSPSIQTTLWTKICISAPSPPQKPRTFVTYIRSPLTSNYTIRVSLHWSFPEHPNGQVTSYTLYQAEDLGGPWTRWIVNDRLHRQLPGAKHFHRYYFQVKTHSYNYHYHICT